MEEKMVKVGYNLKVAQDRKNIYANKRMTYKKFKFDEHMFLKVKAKRSSLRLGSCQKLAARYCGTFEFLEKIGPVAYMLLFPASMRIHNVFHVFLLKKYVPDPNHVIDWSVIHVEQEGAFWVELVCILDQKVKFLRNKPIILVKVQWTCYGPEDSMWENEETMWEEYP
jgi:hypothetical protein